MFRGVLFQRLILGTLVFLGCIIAVGIVYLKRIESQAQSEIAKITKQVQSLKETSAETHTASATDSGHWHGDIWHAEAHEAEETVLPGGGIQSDGVWYPDDYTQADIAGEGAATDEEYQRRHKKHWVNNYLRKHREKYPDCTEQEAVLADAIRQAEWRFADQIYTDKDSKLTAEHERIMDELIPLLEKYNHKSAYEATHIPESERLNDVARIKTLMAQIEGHGERKAALRLEEPVYPKAMHTH